MPKQRPDRLGETTSRRPRFYWTVKVVTPLVEPDVAVIVVLPGAAVVAKPLLLIVAIVLSLEVHIAELVITLLVLFEYVAVAVNC